MSKKETFLANSENKQCFIELLSKTMQENGIVTKHAFSDADVLIAKTAIQSALKAQTVLLGEIPIYLFFYYSFTSLPHQSLSFDQKMTK